MKIKGSKKKKYLILGAMGGAILTVSAVTPIIILNDKIDQIKKADESVKKEDELVKKEDELVKKEDETINKIAEILKNKSNEEKIIVLPSDVKGKIIADNQDKIIPKIKTLIGEENLKEAKMEILMSTDLPISTTLQNIIVSISKSDESNIKTTSIFKVKREFTSNELSNKDIESIKTILDSKTGNDLTINLPSDSNGKIVSKVVNKNAVEKELRILVDPSNTNGEANHASLKGTTISVSMEDDAPISTTSQNIIVSISKIGGKTLKTTKIFQVKREFTNVEFIKNIFDNKTRDDLIITLPSDSNGDIISKVVNKNAIEKELRKLIDPSNVDGQVNHQSLRGTTLSVSMDVDAPISTTPQSVIVSISKSGEKTLNTRKIFQVKRELTNTELIHKDIESIKTILEAKIGDDLIINLPSDSSGNIVGKVANKNAITRELRKLIDPLNTNGNSNHASLRGTTISVSMDVDAPISTTAQNIIVSISKTGGTTLKITNTFQVKRKFTIEEINEDIQAIKTILDAKTGDDLIISIPSYSNGNIIKNVVNKNEIKQELRKLIDSSNLYGEANHPSLRRTTIEVSMDSDAPISTKPQNIIVSISKTGGTTLRTIKTFQVKRELTNTELIDKDIESIKTVLEAKTGNDLIITLPSNSTGNIIGSRKNKNAIEKELRKLIDPSNKNGDSNHPSLKRAQIVIYMDVDAPISTKPQNIIVTIRKLNRSHTLTKTFQVKRDFTANENIELIKTILEAKTGNDLIITLPSDSNGNIISKIANKNAIERKLRKLIDPLNTNGNPNHPSLKGTTIEVSMNVDAPISTIPQNIIVSIAKAGGTTLKVMNTFQVKRAFTDFEDVFAIQKILDAKTGNDLIITLPSDSSGDIIGNFDNKNAVEKELRKLIDPSNIDGDVNHPSLRGTTIEVSSRSNEPISTTLQKIIVFVKKNISGVITVKTFQINKYDAINQDIVSIQKILDAKTGNDLIITLPSDSTGSILDNRNAILKKLRILVDSSNTSGDVNHPSLRGTDFNIFTSGSISTTPQNIIVLISKSGGKTISTTKNFQVKKDFTPNEDIAAIKKILDSKIGNDLIITLPSDLGGNIIDKLANKNAIEKVLRKLIDPSNKNGDPNHPSLRGTTIEVSMEDDRLISTTLQNIIVSITKAGGTTFTTTKTFQVKRAFTNAEKITNYFANNAKKAFTIFGGKALNTKAKILAAIKKHLAQDDPNLWTNVVQSLISVDNDETTNAIVKENYDETSFSIVYKDDDGMTQNVELRFRHLRTKIENRIIVNNLYDYYKNKWNTRAKALILTTIRFFRDWDGTEIKNAVNDATKNIYLENKVLFDVKRIFHVDWHNKEFFIIRANTRNSWHSYSNNLEKGWRFEVTLYSGRGKKVSSRNMIIFIKAIKKTRLTTS